MIENLLSLLGSGGIHKVSNLMNIVSQVIKAFEGEFVEDKNIKDAAIDTFIAFLQREKSTPPTS